MLFVNKSPGFCHNSSKKFTTPVAKTKRMGKNMNYPVRKSAKGIKLCYIGTEDSAHENV